MNQSGGWADGKYGAFDSAGPVPGVGDPIGEEIDKEPQTPRRGPHAMNPGPGQGDQVGEPAPPPGPAESLADDWSTIRQSFPGAGAGDPVGEPGPPPEPAESLAVDRSTALASFPDVGPGDPVGEDTVPPP